MTQENISSRRILVLGCGNDLRGDDAVGRIAAEKIEALNLIGVEVWSGQMFTPEIAPMLAAADLAIFIDACQNIDGAEARIRSVEIDNPEPGQTHHASPPSLLGLADWLYGSAPKAFAIDIPATRFEITSELTQQAEEGVESAVRAAIHIIETELPAKAEMASS